MRDYKVTGVQTFSFFFQAEDGIRDYKVTGVQTCALPIFQPRRVRLPVGRMSTGKGTGDGAGMSTNVRSSARDRTRQTFSAAISWSRSGAWRPSVHSTSRWPNPGSTGNLARTTSATE